MIPVNVTHCQLCNNYNNRLVESNWWFSYCDCDDIIKILDIINEVTDEKISFYLNYLQGLELFQ